jgi:transposase
MRRSQILLASAAGQRPSQIAQSLGCATQTVRNAIRAFTLHGLNCLQEQSHRPQSVTPIFTAPKCEQLRELMHHSPRHFNKPRSHWTLALVAEVCFTEGLTPQLVSDETIRQALKRLGQSWRRAKHWITSPDPEYERKKSDATG